MKLPDYVARFLVSRGAEQLFAISGASNLRLLDAMARHPALRYVCPHHEQAGVMAAITYTRLSGRPGVMVVTAGPGAANTVTGLASAHLDSIPMFVIAGQEKSDYLDPRNGCRGKGVQGLEMTRIVAPVTKLAVRLEDPRAIRRVLEEAFHVAHAGRPGPVWIEIPQDLQTADVEPDELEPFVPPPIVEVDYAAAARRLLAMLATAQRPLLWVGHGVRLAGAVAEFRRVLDRLGVPTLAAWNGADLVEETHPLYAGRAGTYGQRAANFAVQNCDLLVALGTRLAIPQLGYLQKEFARAARKVVVEIDPAELAKFDPAPELALCGDVGAFLRELDRQIEAPGFERDHSAWAERCRHWRRRYPSVTDEHRLPVPGKVNSYDFIDQLSEELAPEDVIVTDMGTSLTCTHAAIRLRAGQRLVTSTGLGEMGFGLPGAIGAALGAGGRRVVFIGTEGSLMMNLQELQTVVHLGLELKIFLLNNNGYLTIRHTENALFGAGHLTACTPETGVTFPDLSRLAAVFGFATFEIDDRDRCGELIRAALARSGPVFCNVRMPDDQFLGPKTAVKVRADGSLFSPPLEDLFPFLPRDEFADNMLIPLLPEE